STHPMRGSGSRSALRKRNLSKSRTQGSSGHQGRTSEGIMTNKGWSHISLGTLDMDATRKFYEGVLGFKAVRCDIIQAKEARQIRHVFFDTGQKQLLAFMEPRGVPGVPVEFDGGLNRPLGMPEGVYHFAFEAGSQGELEAKRAELIGKGVKVTPVVDHEWAKSIYFKDPNG